MPRLPRIDNPGLLQHVIVRGVARSNIFIADNDRMDFVNRFAVLLRDTQTQCLAWALLDNHIHLLLRPTSETLARFMRRLLTGYAVAFNLRHQRSGHLFQNRYKSIVCDTDVYLLELIRYIHLNPLRAGIVTTLNDLVDYPWCGHRQLVGTDNGQIIAADVVLALFAKHKDVAIANYLKFMADGLKVNEDLCLSSGGRKISQAMDRALGDDDMYDQRILGGGDFVEQVLANSALTTDIHLPLETIIEYVAQFYHLSVDQLQCRCKQTNIVHAKALICYIATRRHAIAGKSVAEALTHV